MPVPAPDYDDILCDALLAAHGGRGRLRLLPDEELHRAALALRRAEYDTLAALDERGPVATATTALALSMARGAVADEEARRERGRQHGIPRDQAGTWVPDQLVRAIRSRLSPVEVFRRWGLTDLRELRGGKWLGLCPWHEDDTPSLYVYTADPDDQHFHCFGCGAHGDVFDLAKRHTGRSFRECCEGLASVAGIAWPDPPVVIKPARPGSGPRGGIVLHRRQGGA
jgi:hypothetical protein